MIPVDRCLLLIRNPYEAILAEFNRKSSGTEVVRNTANSSKQRFINGESVFPLTPLSHERLVANAHELGTSQDSLETSRDGLRCVSARPCMSRQVTETERENPFFSHSLVVAVDFILSREIKFSPPPATKMQLNCIGPSRLGPCPS